MKKIFLVTMLVSLFMHGYSQVNIPDSVQLTKANDTLTKVEQDATFPGGSKAWFSFLQKELRPNVPVNKGAPAGTYNVVARFVISTDGSVEDISSETNFGYGMEDELIRVIRKSPKWIPAILMNGQPVRAFRRQPLTFIVEEEKKKKKRWF